MRYQLVPLYCRPWTLNGISARLIESHYENNYGAALNLVRPGAQSAAPSAELSKAVEAVQQAAPAAVPNTQSATVAIQVIANDAETALHALEVQIPKL